MFDYLGSPRTSYNTTPQLDDWYETLSAPFSYVYSLFAEQQQQGMQANYDEEVTTKIMKQAQSLLTSLEEDPNQSITDIVSFVMKHFVDGEKQADLWLI